MIRSKMVAALLFLAMPGVQAQQDDAPIDPSVVEGPHGSLIEAGPDFGASGEFAPEIMERIRGGALGRVYPAQGSIDDVELDGPTVVIDGLRYDFAPDASVTLLSGYGAPTLLQDGMSARFVFEANENPETAGRIHRLEEVEPDGSLEH